MVNYPDLWPFDKNCDLNLNALLAVSMPNIPLEEKQRKKFERE